MNTVSFEDYEHDTRELAERAGVIIANQKHQIERLERDAQILLWALVRAAGGHLFVPDGSLARGIPTQRSIEVDYANNGTHYRIVER